MTEVRTRFAPSPTGYVHIGSVRTALYNYLFAKKSGGKYLLRVEDTDQTRKVEGSIENLLQVMERLGLGHDIGPGKEDEFGPYFQSERTSLYQDSVGKLLAGGNAYRCFCTPERLDEMREAQRDAGEAVMYDRRCRNLPDQESEDRSKTEAHTIRLKVPLDGQIDFVDLVRGHVSIPFNAVDDQVLLKVDGFPTYHLANVVDDNHMQITHVIRGEEWLTSLPKHLLLYEYLGWEPPKFAHLPLILNPDKTKLSKRQGDVAAEDFLQKGYLEETLINFLALLGWNPGDNREILTLEELVQEFSLERVSKSGAVLDREKLDWMNGQYLKKEVPQERYLDLVTAQMSEEQKSEFESTEILDKSLLSIRNNLNAPAEVSEYLHIFTTPFDTIDLTQGPVAEILAMETNATLFDALSQEISQIEEFDSQTFRAAIKAVQKGTKIKGKALYMPLRVALTGFDSGPELFIFAEILGKDEILRRIAKVSEHNS